ncbi:MAG: GTPase, partial [Candidatus Aminicenantales bacterium]
MTRPPLVAIVGFPNVGKSTLFNRLVRQKKALVHNLPGMTRDRVAATAEIAGRRVEFMDTGGLIDVLDKAEPLAVRVHEMAWDGARRADVLLLVLDGIRGLLPAERDLYRDLKKLNKPLLVAINKIDAEW